jgi:TolB-like protein/DNA-binding winged helix-turn-helix (wHTH) protein/Tfp pilus assembly protein PilF
MSDVPRQRRIRFGLFEFDVRAGALTKSGRRVALAGQPVTILERLTDRAGDVVTREELQKELWPADTFVDFEHNLNSAVKRLRAALGDSAESPRYIETLPRRGYRFLVPVEIIEPAPAAVVAAPAVTPPATVTPARSRSRWLAAAVIVIAAGGAASIAALLMGWPLEGDPRVDAPVRSIAVLPFANLSNDPDQEYFTDGIAEALTAELSRIQSLLVTSRTSSIRYRSTDKTVPQIAKELGVDAVIEGSVQREGNQIRVTVQLIRGATDVHLWANQYERSLDSALELQIEVARAIAGEIRLNFAPAQHSATGQSVPLEATQLYLRGRHLLNRRTQAGVLQALEYFERARTIAPRYAPAYAGIALAWEAQASWAAYVAPREGFPKAKAAAEQALALDPSLSDAHLTLAFVADVFESDFAAAERGYQNALELNPSNATAAQRYALHLRRRGRLDAALQQASRARDLDPLSRDANTEFGLHLVANGRVDEAIAQLERAIAMDPAHFDPYVHLAEAYIAAKRPEQAIAAARKGVELSTGSAHAMHALIGAHIAAGAAGEARRLLDGLEKRPVQRDAYEIAVLRLRLGDTSEALSWLNRACEERAPQFAFFDVLSKQSAFDPVRRDPRFDAILRCSQSRGASDRIDHK